MAEATVRVRGLAETQRALRKVNKEAAKEVRDALKTAAGPVVSTAKLKLGVYPGASVGTIGPKVTMRSVFVTQRARKVTGLRPDFGRLQMTHVLEPALDEHVDDVVDEVEDALENLGRREGF
jgi:hypothetical protein